MHIILALKETSTHSCLCKAGESQLIYMFLMQAEAVPHHRTPIYFSAPLTVLYVLLKVRSEPYTAFKALATADLMMLSALFSSSSFLPLNISVAHLPSLEMRFSQNYYYAKILFLSHKSPFGLFLYI